MIKSRFKNSKERSKKISISLTDRKLSTQHIKNIKLGLSKYYKNGGINPMKGKKQSLKSKKLQSKNAATKRQDVKDRISQSHLKRYKDNPDLRRIVSEKTKEKMKKVDMSEIVKKAYKTNPDYREKIRLARLKQVFPTRDTKIELKIQEELKNRRIKFVKNKALLNRFRVDLFIEPNIVIECDGCYYHACKQCKMTKHHQYAIKRDAKKTKILKKNGFKVYRFWGHEINDSAEKCLRKIRELNGKTTDKITKIIKGKYE